MCMPEDKEIIEFTKRYPIVGGMMSQNQIYGVLYHLKKVIDEGIEGDVVELGCNWGTTSIFIKKFLEIHAPDKNFHVYDSFEGLPEKHQKDMSCSGLMFKKGSCRTTKDVFIKRFKDHNVNLPVINTGWFSQIPDDSYPEKICFAFYDGDFYTSIMDSFHKTFHKVQEEGVILIDDVGGTGNFDLHPLPGAERACIDFLENREENYDYLGYPDKSFLFGTPSGGARIIKK